MVILTPDTNEILKTGINKILVPVDYSECSFLACKYAVRLASYTNASIQLLHTFYSPAFDLVELTTKYEREKLKKEIFESEQEIEQKRLEEFEKNLNAALIKNGYRDVPIHSEIVPGIPLDEILAYSKKMQPDLIIMGTKGRNKETAIMGSVTAKVISRETTPVLAIPEDYIFVGRDQIREIIYVTEFDESDFLTIKVLNDLAWPTGFKLHFVHACKSPGSTSEQKKLDSFKNYFTTHYPDINFSVYSFENKDLLTQIDELILQNKIKLIAVKNFRKSLIKRLFQGNITKRLFYHTTVPLLVFHG